MINSSTVGLVDDFQSPNDVISSVELSADRSECIRFEFYMYAVAVGTLCVLGFAANTVALMLVRRHKMTLLRCVRLDQLTADFDVLLQACLVMDICALWALFVGHVIPSLAYVTPLLHRCQVTCRIMAAVHRPLSTLTQTLVVWMTSAAVIRGHHSVATGGETSSTRRRSGGGSFSERDSMTSGRSTVPRTLRIMGLCLTALIYVSPMTFDSWLLLPTATSSPHQRHAANESQGDTTEVLMMSSASNNLLEDNSWYQIIYVHLISLFVLVVPLVCILGVAVGGCCRCGGHTSDGAVTTRLAGGPADLNNVALIRHRNQPSHRQRHNQSTSESFQMNDVANVASALTTTLLVSYLPQVALRSFAWFNGSLRWFYALSTCFVNRTTANVDTEPTTFMSSVAINPLLLYCHVTGQLLVAVNSAIKLPLLCAASKQHRDCLRRVCCRWRSRASTLSGDDADQISPFRVTMSDIQKQQRRWQKRNRRWNAQSADEDAIVPYNTAATTTSSSARTSLMSTTVVDRVGNNSFF